MKSIIFILVAAVVSFANVTVRGYTLGEKFKLRPESQGVYVFTDSNNIINMVVTKKHKSFYDSSKKYLSDKYGSSQIVYHDDYESHCFYHKGTFITMKIENGEVVIIYEYVGN